MFDKIEKDLINFEKPARYTGNESGIPQKDFINSDVRMVISYPDIYEIGMSNNGIKIIYDIVNKIDYASCERVFAPWTDFEKYLRENQYKLYSLESKTPLCDFDIVGISIQYELLFSNFLNIIELGGIPLRRAERTEDAPIVIIGGPAISNPKPYYPFADIIVIGEGEEVIKEIIDSVKRLKKEGKTRIDIIENLSEINGVISPQFTSKRVQRRVYTNFVNDTGIDISIIPLIDIIQNKLVVEIMRGCPNKCRFCQAGVLYKPYREKNIKSIMDNVEKGLNKTGVNEVTFASLSSGDYSKIIELCDYFNSLYSEKGISVSLPSLKVETFDTDILDKISLIRKSGLTFAIESGSREGQLSINKRVDVEKINSIITYAFQKGWRLVKFYFMIGLPDEKDELNDITSFIDNILKTHPKLMINLNIAVFVPKPHTPYESVKQLEYETSKDKLFYIKDYYRRSRVKVKMHPPEMSYIEGFITRGDENVGYALEEAFRSGARFDGWNDKFNFKLYTDIFLKFNISYEKYLSGMNTDKPWSVVDPLLSEQYLKTELEKSHNNILTPVCKEECESECDICRNDIKVNNAADDFKSNFLKIDNEEINGKFRYMIEFTKKGLSKYLSHKDIMRYFETLFRITGIKLLLSEGFNPHPRFQFSSAVSLGLESNSELLEFFTKKEYIEDEIFKKINSILNNDIVIKRIRKCSSLKKQSLYDNLYYTEYKVNFMKSEKTEVLELINKFNNSFNFLLDDDKGIFDLKKIVYFTDLNEDNVTMNIYRVNPGPKLIKIVKTILLNKEITIIKNRMFTGTAGDVQELYFLD